MKSRAVWICVAIPFLWLAGLPREARSASFATDNKSGFVAECLVDGVAEQCLLDTGANRELSLRRGGPFDQLPVIETGGMVGASGASVATATVRVQSLNVGELTATQPATILYSSPRQQSLLGLPFFERQGALSFDFRSGDLNHAAPISDATACSGAVGVAPLLTIPVDVAGRRVTAQWDTGASLTVADAKFVDANPDLFEFVRQLPNGGDSVSNSVPVRLFRAKSLSICGHEFRDVMIVAVDLSKARAANPALTDITIGANLMRGHIWRFDFMNRLWTFE